MHWFSRFASFQCITWVENFNRQCAKVNSGMIVPNDTFVGKPRSTMQWEANITQHKKQSRVAVHFPKDAGLIGRIKKPDGARWSARLKAWHVPDTAAYRKQLGLPPLPGHSSSKTTEIYTHVSTQSLQRIVSPFETL